MEVCNERRSLGITDHVNAFGICDCLSNVISSTPGSLDAQSYSQNYDDIKIHVPAFEALM